ncbi:hypothetical protein VIGAN_06047800, partial [Vigna angularis var. angularis]
KAEAQCSLAFKLKTSASPRSFLWSEGIMSLRMDVHERKERAKTSLKQYTSGVTMKLVPMAVRWERRRRLKK